MSDFRAEPDRPLPLEGIVVLDLGQIYQGPYAGFLMAQAGARVIKVEPPRGEPARSRGSNLPLALLNAGKEAVSIDLKNPAGLDLFRRMVPTADVVSMNYAPGVPERLGIGAEELLAINPRLVHAHACGFGVRQPDGALVESSIPAMDLTVQAHSGAMSVTGEPDGAPMKSAAAYIDFLGGTHLYGAITTALFERERTGRGRSVEVAMVDAAHFALATQFGQWQLAGRTQRTGNRHAGLGLAPYNVYRCADGWLAIIAPVERNWQSILEVIGREELIGDERYSSRRRRGERIEEVDAIVESWTRNQQRLTAAAALQRAHVPAAAVRSVDEAMRDVAQHERGALQWVEHPTMGTVPLAASPIRWHDSQLVELEIEPSLGRDNAAVLAELAGVDTDELRELEATGVVNARAY